MQSKVLLPFADPSYSIMYHGIAFPMGIIQANADKDITPWLSSKYINCWFMSELDNQFAYYFSDHWATKENILIHQKVELYGELLDSLYGDVIALLRKMLDLGYYPHGDYNEECIPGKWSYQNRYFLHDFLLIGYDDQAQCFLSVGFVNNSHFQRFEIPYECMRLAITTLKKPKIFINFWKYNPAAKFDFRHARFLSELSDYLHSRVSEGAFSKEGYWGMTALRQLSEYFLDCCNEGNGLDIRYTRGLMEHKFYMQMRMEYLVNQGYVQDVGHLDNAKQVYQLAEKLHLLAMKYDFKRDKNIGLRICETVNRMLALEQAYLPSVLSDVRRCFGGV